MGNRTKPVYFVCCECGDEMTEMHDDLCPSCWYVTHGGDLGMSHCWPPFKIVRADGANVYVSFGAPA